MSLRNISRWLMSCDAPGCDRTFSLSDPSDRSETAMEVRASAYVSGWRYPPKIKKDGKTGTMSDDYCPMCAAVQ